MKFKLKVPETYTIICFLILLMAVFSYVLPTGEYDRKTIDGRQVVVPGTYHYIEPNPQGLMNVLTSPIRGIMEVAEILGFVFIIGGVFCLINKTGATESGINHLIRKFKGSNLFLIVIVMIAFSIGGTSIGTWEETIPFYIILVSVMVRLKYDPIVGVACIVVGACLGTAGSTINPFAAGLSAEFAEIPLKDGMLTRVILYIALSATGITYVCWYANKITKDPSKSLVADKMDEIRKSLHDESKQLDESKQSDFLLSHKLILLTLAFGIILIFWGVVKWKWYIQEMSAVYIVVGLVASILGRLGQKQIINTFNAGMMDITSAAFIIGLARAIVLVAQDSKIIDTILYAAANLLEGTPNFVFINLLVVVQNAIAYIVPSSTGQAALTVSIMAGLADIVEVPRNIVVSSLGIGAGITSMITPTAGVLIAALSVGKIPFTRWFKFILPLVIIANIVAMIILTLQYQIGF